MRYLLITLLAFGLVACGGNYDNWQTECNEKAALNAKSDASLKVLLQVCADKNIPKKCRNISQDDIEKYDAINAKMLANEQSQVNKVNEERSKGSADLGTPIYLPDLYKRSYSDQCLNECDSANFFLKRYGACSKG